MADHPAPTGRSRGRDVYPTLADAVTAANQSFAHDPVRAVVHYVAPDDGGAPRIIETYPLVGIQGAIGSRLPMIETRTRAGEQGDPKPLTAAAWLDHGAHRAVRYYPYGPGTTTDAMARQMARDHPGVELIGAFAYAVPRRLTLPTGADAPPPGRLTDPFAWPTLRTWAAHGRDIWCRGDAEAWQNLLDWTVRALAYPGDRGGQLIVARGVEGCGKNAWLAPVLDCFHSAHRYVTQSSGAVTADFNGQLEGVSLFVLNESLWAGSGKEGDALKHYVTEPAFDLNAKHKQARQVHNSLSICVLTNRTHAARMATGDRRTLALHVSDAWKQRQQSGPDGAAAYRAHFEALGRTPPDHLLTFALHYAAADAIRYDLLTDAYRAADADEQIRQSLNDLDAVIAAWIEAGEIVVTRESDREGKRTVPFEALRAGVAVADLHTAALTAGQRTSVRLIARLVDLTGATRTRASLPGVGQVRVLHHPDPDAARRAAAAALRVETDDEA